LRADKSLFGTPEWAEEGSVAKLTSAVVNATGVVIGGLSFRAAALIETTIQRGSATLVLDNLPIQRVLFQPDHPHVNKGAHPIPLRLRLRRLPPERTRIYRWEDNRVWPMRDNMGAATVVEPEPDTYMDAMKLFLEACGITAYLPPPPHRPQLELV
jgi:hypothetical protein